MNIFFLLSLRSKQRQHVKNFFFELTVDDSIVPIDKDNLEKIGDFDTGNGIISVCKSKDASGTYQYIIIT